MQCQQLLRKKIQLVPSLPIKSEECFNRGNAQGTEAQVRYDTALQCLHSSLPELMYNNKFNHQIQSQEKKRIKEFRQKECQKKKNRKF